MQIKKIQFISLNIEAYFYIRPITNYNFSFIFLFEMENLSKNKNSETQKINKMIIYTQFFSGRKKSALFIAVAIFFLFEYFSFLLGKKICNAKNNIFPIFLRHKHLVFGNNNKKIRSHFLNACCVIAPRASNQRTIFFDGYVEFS